MLMSFPEVPERDRLDHAAELQQSAASRRSTGVRWDQNRGADGAVRCFCYRALSALLLSATVGWSRDGHAGSHWRESHSDGCDENRRAGCEAGSGE